MRHICQKNKHLKQTINAAEDDGDKMRSTFHIVIAMNGKLFCFLEAEWSESCHKNKNKINLF